ncbi:MAG TPA: ATP-binding cassette domain-containing protein, partial [Cyclobacteriaceae bacterium]
GFNVITGFFAQHQLESLHVENEILEELKQAGSKKLDQELRGVLGCFLFSGDDVYKKIKVLSGGEKSRVALAKTLISDANFLLLDEPTNHLDFISENILIQALQQYEGTFVTVSHNRHFVTNVANKIWWIEDNQIKEYPGTYEEYEYWRKKNEATAVKTAPPVKKEEPKVLAQPVQKADNKNEKRLKTLRQELKKTEDSIQKLEEEKTKVENELAKPEVYSDHSKLQKLQQEFDKVNSTYLAANTKWEELVTEIDTLESE